MRHLFDVIRTFLLGSGQVLSARVLVEQIMLSLRLQPVSMVGQLLGATVIVARFWDRLNDAALVVWFAALVMTLASWVEYRRRFTSDAHREAHIREWLKVWMIASITTGALWGAAGTVLFATQQTIDVVVLVSVIVAVAFASWPAFSCWLPSLTIVMFLFLAPTIVALASVFEIGSFATGAVLVVLLGFVLYCGRHINAIVVLAVTREMQNERLVARLKSEKALAESERRATALASERRAKFFAGANHDLRQPLQAMGIYVQILRMQATDADREVIAQLDNAAKNISTLVEQLLEVSRLETGYVEVKTEDVHIEQLFAELAHEFVPVAAAKQLVFLTRPLPVSVHTDPVLVSRILRNLITNAIGYTTKPGGRIVLGARRIARGRITIGVYDEGPGIDREERAKIFEAFYRGSAGKHGTKGFGLGLSIVKGLAKRLGVTLSVGSRPGKGSVFRLTFDAVQGEQSALSAPVRAKPTDLDMRGVVGVLEDNDIVRTAVASILKSWGATVVSAAEPNKAFVDRMIMEAEEGNLTGLISDYNLGDGVSTGLEVIFTVRLGARRRFASVLLTAVSEDEIRRAYRELCLHPDHVSQSMPVILQKPVTAQALASALRRAIAQKPSRTL